MRHITVQDDPLAEQPRHDGQQQHQRPAAVQQDRIRTQEGFQQQPRVGNRDKFHFFRNAAAVTRTTTKDRLVPQFHQLAGKGRIAHLRPTQGCAIGSFIQKQKSHAAPTTRKP
ncbi:hypothetical protein D3C85_1519840 [compost metagenome]